MTDTTENNQPEVTREQLQRQFEALKRTRQQQQSTKHEKDLMPLDSLPLLHRIQALCQSRTNWEEERPPAVPLCPRCNGAGFVGRSLPPGHPEFGRAMPCPDCHQARQRERLAAHLAEAWPLSPEDARLANTEFEDRGGIQGVINMWKLRRAFLEGLPAKKILALQGPPGTGKSHLLLTIHLAVRKAGLTAIYITGLSLQERLMNFGFDDESRRRAEEKRQKDWQDLITVDVLILDELDDISGDYMKKKLKELFNLRLSSGLATAIAGNRLNSLDDPIASRAMAYQAWAPNNSGWLDLVDVPDARPIYGHGGRDAE